MGCDIINKLPSKYLTRKYVAKKDDKLSIRDIKIRYVIYYELSNKINYCYRTLGHIERGLNGLLEPIGKVIARNQSTEMSDITKKPIFEHDIVLLTNKVIGEIVWKDGGFWVEDLVNLTVYYSMATLPMTIVGNIYDGREILEQVRKMKEKKDVKT